MHKVKRPIHVVVVEGVQWDSVHITSFDVCGKYIGVSCTCERPSGRTAIMRGIGGTRRIVCPG